MNIIDFLEKEGLPRSQGRRLLSQGAIKINNEVITSVDANVDVKSDLKINIGKCTLTYRGRSKPRIYCPEVEDE